MTSSAAEREQHNFDIDDSPTKVILTQLVKRMIEIE